MWVLVPTSENANYCTRIKFQLPALRLLLGSDSALQRVARPVVFGDRRGGDAPRGRLWSPSRLILIQKITRQFFFDYLFIFFYFSSFFTFLLLSNCGSSTDNKRSRVKRKKMKIPRRHSIYSSYCDMYASCDCVPAADAGRIMHVSRAAAGTLICRLTTVTRRFLRSHRRGANEIGAGAVFYPRFEVARICHPATLALERMWHSWATALRRTAHDTPIYANYNRLINSSTRRGETIENYWIRNYFQLEHEQNHCVMDTALAPHTPGSKLVCVKENAIDTRASALTEEMFIFLRVRQRKHENIGIGVWTILGRSW